VKGPDIRAEDYTEMIGYSLMYFQLIEEALRDYLGKKGVKYRKEDSLGQLVFKFKKNDPTDPLGNKLDDINQQRIRIAHKIWLEKIQTTREMLEEARKDINKVLQDYFKGKAEELFNIQSEAKDYLIELIFKVRSLS
jgi:hypothetical protein